jgi:hypothetical protein
MDTIGQQLGVQRDTPSATTYVNHGRREVQAQRRSLGGGNQLSAWHRRGVGATGCQQQGGEQQ